MFSRKVLMFCLFYGACSAVVGGGYWGYRRVHLASQRVAARHLLGEPPTGAQRMRELAVEAVKGGPGVTTGTGAFAGVPAAPVPGERIGSWDARTVSELKREGIDVSDVNEVRAALRAALTEPDPQVRLKKALELRSRYGVAADPALLGRLDALDAGGRASDTMPDRRQGVVGGFVDGIARLYRGLLQEVDR